MVGSDNRLGLRRFAGGSWQHRQVSVACPVSPRGSRILVIGLVGIRFRDAATVEGQVQTIRQRS